MKRIKLVVFFILGLFMLASCGSLNHESFPNGPQIEEPGTNPDGEASSYLLTYYENGLKVYQEKIESGKELPQVEATKSFKITVEAKVIKTASVKQAGFGLMLRDDVYLNEQNSSILSNYVAAGFLCGDSSMNIL